MTILIHRNCVHCHVV